MAKQNAVFGAITDISRDTVTLTGGTVRFDPADKRTERYVALLEDLRRKQRPVYIETDPASGFVTRVYLPNFVQLENILESPSGEISVTFTRSHAWHVIQRDAEGETLLRTLREAGKDRWLAVTVNDRQEILDVRPYDPPFDLPHLEPPSMLAPKIAWWLWCWLPWNWYRGYCCVSRRRAQELFDLCAATTCDVFTAPAPCIPFMYPDNGCWGRAHEMRRLMLNAGTDSKKVWIYGTPRLHTVTKNHPSCYVEWSWHVAPTICVRTWWWFPFWKMEMVIDPSLFTSPVTKATWKGVQGDPNATLTPTEGWVFSRWAGDESDPFYVETNKVLDEHRTLLQLRSLNSLDGPPPYAHCP